MSLSSTNTSVARTVESNIACYSQPSTERNVTVRQTYVTEGGRHVTSKMAVDGKPKAIRREGNGKVFRELDPFPCCRDISFAARHRRQRAQWGEIGRLDLQAKRGTDQPRQPE
ncbi:hypothetical protein MRX96_050206 [Rhipicephalus microplus]